ncbi:MAG: glutathione S-transferase C-terminal domain-containing protein [Spirochaetaceae bacterium]|jgi:putative glutathione S-transferase|nr:glutathione S-transferase C-terminal domain-containing protein [Spirochaetaceae bacterium]
MAYQTWFDDETGKDGAFLRQKNRFITPFGSGPEDLPVEAGRYRLIWSRACPWATRQMIVRSLLGLEDAVSVGTVSPVRPEGERSDWEFSLDPGGVDPVLRVSHLSELYLRTDPGYSGRFTVPVLVDVRTGKVVNNDYINMTYYWEHEWKALHKKGAPDLLPEHKREEIFALNDIIFKEVNNGVYEAGFARSQEAYEAACSKVFNRLDWLEDRLQEQLEKGPYLLGQTLTDADIRLFVTLVRFDAAYYNCFRVNKKRIRDYPNLWAYSRRLYQIPAFRDNTDFDHIKIHYHRCCDPGNKYQLVPKGPDPADWNEPVDKARIA